MTKLSPAILKKAESLTKTHPDSMVGVFEHSGYYRYASPSHQRLIGYPPGELLKKTLLDILAPEDLPHAQLALMDAVLHGKSVTISVVLLAKSGRRVPVKTHGWNVTDPDTKTDFLLAVATPAEPGQRA